MIRGKFTAELMMLKLRALIGTSSGVLVNVEQPALWGKKPDL